MNPIYEANTLIHEILLTNELILQIGIHDFFIEGWNYISPYPLVMITQEKPTEYSFLIRLFRYQSTSNSLIIRDLLFSSTLGANIIYVPNQVLRDSENKIGENLEKNETFLNEVKPLLLKGFREQAFIKLMGSE